MIYPYFLYTVPIINHWEMIVIIIKNKMIMPFYSWFEESMVYTSFIHDWIWIDMYRRSSMLHWDQDSISIYNTSRSVLHSKVHQQKYKFTTPHLQQNNITHFHWNTRITMVLIIWTYKRTNGIKEEKNLSCKYHIVSSQSYIFCQPGTC